MSNEIRTIRARWGIRSGANFTRVLRPTEVEIIARTERAVYGWIAGDPEHPCAFMRESRVPVQFSEEGLEPRSKMPLIMEIVS